MGMACPREIYVGKIERLESQTILKEMSLGCLYPERLKDENTDNLAGNVPKLLYTWRG
jgi:hypothetical protein